MFGRVMELIIWFIAFMLNALMTLLVVDECGVLSVEATAQVACTVACYGMVCIELMEADRAMERDL